MNHRTNTMKTIKVNSPKETKGKRWVKDIIRIISVVGTIVAVYHFTGSLITKHNSRSEKEHTFVYKVYWSCNYSKTYTLKSDKPFKWHVTNGGAFRIYHSNKSSLFMTTAPVEVLDYCVEEITKENN